MKKQINKAANVHQGNGNGPQPRLPEARCYFEVAIDAEEKWQWCLWSGNGRQLACSLQGFDRRNDCTHQIYAIIAGITPQTRIVIAHAKGKAEPGPKVPPPSMTDPEPQPEEHQMAEDDG